MAREPWEFSRTRASDPVEAFRGLVFLGPAFLEADAAAPHSPGGHGQRRKFLEFVSDGRC